MTRRTISPAIVLLALAALLSVDSRADAQDWVGQVFPERSFDLGTVARGSKLRHTFPVVNRTNQDLRIVDTQKKCGCTEVRLGAKEIPPGTQTFVEVVLDTTKFTGYKASGVTLILDRPVATSIDLNLTSFIRSDVTLNPGSVDFGAVPRQGQPSQTLALQYAGGQPNWQITSMETISSAVSAQVQPTGRAGGSAQYQLTVTLDPSALTGTFRDEIVLTTNDPSSPRIPVSVSAIIQSGVTASPATLVLGRLKPGQSVKANVFVRSARPFKVTEVRPIKGELAAAGGQDAARPLHTIALTITAPSSPGPFTTIAEIATDVPDEPPVKVTAFATVAP